MIVSPTSQLLPVSADIEFHSWCDSVGINITSSALLVTTPQSVAGRGVFAIDLLKEGDVVAQIPYQVVFHPNNAAACFPDTANEIHNSKVRSGVIENEDTSGGRFRWIKKLWNKRKEKKQFDEKNDDTLSQAELTKYALAAQKEEHPWGRWISQWQRDDPTFRLFTSNAKPLDEETISATVDELSSIMPNLPRPYLMAALGIRLNRLDEHRQIVGLDDDPETSALYSLLGSRVCTLDEDITGVIPFYDMVNHSLNPNISLSYEAEGIELYANCEIESGEELFLCYTKLDEPMDETRALWTLIQWGIPVPASDIVADELN